MTLSLVVASAWLNGTTPVNLPNTDNVYAVGGLKAFAAGVNGTIGTNIIIKDSTGATVLTVPVVTTTALLGSYTGLACDVPDFSTTVTIGTNPLTAQLSSNLTSGQIGLILGTNKAS